MIGDMIKHKRKERGLSLSELSRMTGVSKSYLSYIERGLKKNPSIIIVKKIFSTLDLPLSILNSYDYFFEDYEERHKKLSQ
ncbi:helix-turn-helix domain-containing protein [Evansella halocellulosilytica]|uniref:helix-turn-helix domain-containing protein n=1 Tax=Evansella halocellulosilytica TaxID=2011013 RepID=UPI000BB78ED9|nr:helix-turn-helix transcriptional regulator [Evansella halocellulosilytica]